MKHSTQSRLVISPEVKQAFFEKKGIVALESTVITHGLPFPDNLATARALENEVRQNGAIPATIAVIDGKICVGLSDNALEKLAQQKDALKISRRDLPVAMALGQSGGTTVATTMMVAAQAGIRVFATGGIGGVHRGAEKTFDISADLEELGRTNVCVVCAGAKAVLDIPKTMEVLETKGVTTVSYQCDSFPAFYYRESGERAACRIDNVEDIVKLMTHKWNLSRWPDSMKFEGAILVGNPISHNDEYPKEDVEQLIERALNEMDVSGRDVTPYLLARLGELSAGKSKQSNMALLKNNAALGAKIAVQLQKQQS